MIDYVATINWEDGALRLYCSDRVPHEDYMALRKMGFKNRRGETVFKASYTVAREWFLNKQFGIKQLEIDETDLSEDEAERAERYSKYSQNARKDSIARDKWAEREASLIPFGQPILIGHHSERRCRNRIERIHQQRGKAIQSAKRSDYWQRRAAMVYRRAEKRHNAPFIHRRISELEAELRRQYRFLERDPKSEWVKRWIWFFQNRIAFEHGLLANIPPEETPLTKADLKVGGGLWQGNTLAGFKMYIIERVNQKTVSYTAHKLSLKRPITAILPPMYMPPEEIQRARDLGVLKEERGGGFTLTCTLGDFLAGKVTAAQPEEETEQKPPAAPLLLPSCDLRPLADDIAAILKAHPPKLAPMIFKDPSIWKVTLASRLSPERFTYWIQWQPSGVVIYKTQVVASRTKRQNLYQDVEHRYYPACSFQEFNKVMADAFMRYGQFYPRHHVYWSDYRFYEKFEQPSKGIKLAEEAYRRWRMEKRINRPQRVTVTPEVIQLPAPAPQQVGIDWMPAAQRKKVDMILKKPQACFEAMWFNPQEKTVVMQGTWTNYFTGRAIWMIVDPDGEAMLWDDKPQFDLVRMLDLKGKTSLGEETRTMHTLYTFGYAGADSEKFVEFINEKGWMVVDTRYRPYSRQPQWNRTKLQEVIKKYGHIQTLGNVNYKNGGEIKLLNEELGMAVLQKALLDDTVVLLCGCKDVTTCHRGYIAERAREKFGCEVIHLKPADLKRPQAPINPVQDPPPTDIPTPDKSASQDGYLLIQQGLDGIAQDKIVAVPKQLKLL